MREFIGKDLLRSVINNSYFLKSSVNFARSKYKSVKAQVNEMGEFVIFSPYLCFQMNGDKGELNALNLMIKEIQTFGNSIALYRDGPFFDFIMENHNGKLDNIWGVIDSEKRHINNLNVVSSLEELPKWVNNVFICETKYEDIENKKMLIGQLPELNALSPNILIKFPEHLPTRSWIKKSESIYPIKLPSIIIKSGLDILLLDLPARAGQQPSVGTSYIHKALKREDVSLQTIDLDPIWYHKFHMHRLKDLGCEPKLSNGVLISEDAWGYNDRTWVDPRLWPYLIEYFQKDISKLLNGIVGAKPKIVAFSVHARNEWITRHLARMLKKISPEICILVGGHSCYTEHFGKGAFPEYEYMLIGEADGTVGPIVKEICKGHRPKNNPGVISIYDDLDYKYIAGPMPHNLDMLGGLTFEIWGDLTNLLYQTYKGEQSTALPLTRGCVWSRCTFCAERFSFRSRSPKLYVEEIESVLATGRANEFNASDSDFGGRPEILVELCEEIIRRGIKISFTGQIRLNKNFDVNFFRLMKKAGLHSLNFGSDAFTENTIRLQQKGYTIETLIQNHRDCVLAGLVPVVNMVIGVPGETEKDIDETIELIIKRRDCFPIVNNINAALLVQNSVWWFEPEKYGIGFFGDKEDIYKKYYFGVPSRLWYSSGPYIDKAVRATRFKKILSALENASVGLASKEIYSNFNDMLGGVGHLDYRELSMDESLKKWHLLADNNKSNYSYYPITENQYNYLNLGNQIIRFEKSQRISNMILDMGFSTWESDKPKQKLSKINYINIRSDV